MLMRVSPQIGHTAQCQELARGRCDLPMRRTEAGISDKHCIPLRQYARLYRGRRGHGA